MTPVLGSEGLAVLLVEIQRQRDLQSHVAQDYGDNLGETLVNFWPHSDHLLSKANTP